MIVSDSHTQTHPTTQELNSYTENIHGNFTQHNQQVETTKYSSMVNE